MEKKNPGEFRASCLYLLAGIGLWAVGLAVQLLSAPLSREVAAVLGRNKAERHLRGGEATRRRYAERRHE